MYWHKCVFKAKIMESELNQSIIIKHSNSRRLISHQTRRVFLETDGEISDSLLFHPPISALFHSDFLLLILVRGVSAKLSSQKRRSQDAPSLRAAKCEASAFSCVHCVRSFTVLQADCHPHSAHTQAHSEQL